MKFISWNVNGLRACLKKGFEDVFNALDADFFCIQETKMQPGQADFAPAGYTEYIYSADKKGYSGTAIWAKTPALSVRYGLDEDVHNHEGRAITLEYPDFYLVNLYVPNSQNELARIDYRMQWEDDLRRYLQKLDAEKPVILCGDLNVAHEDIDLKNPGPNRGAAGFSDQERGKLGELLAAGFTDSFRHLHPDATGMYSWWSMRFRARERNAGWRIDYFLVSSRLADKIEKAEILMDVMGSDHCPVLLELGTQSDNVCSVVEGVTISSDAICDDGVGVASPTLQEHPTKSKDKVPIANRLKCFILFSRSATNALYFTEKTDPCFSRNDFFRI